MPLTVVKNYQFELEGMVKLSFAEIFTDQGVGSCMNSNICKVNDVCSGNVLTPGLGQMTFDETDNSVSFLTGVEVGYT